MATPSDLIQGKYHDITPENEDPVSYYIVTSIWRLLKYVKSYDGTTLDIQVIVKSPTFDIGYSPTHYKIIDDDLSDWFWKLRGSDIIETHGMVIVVFKIGPLT